MSYFKVKMHDISVSRLTGIETPHVSLTITYVQQNATSLVYFIITLPFDDQLSFRLSAVKYFADWSFTTAQIAFYSCTF